MTGINNNFNVFEEAIRLESIGLNIFDKIKSYLKNQQVDFSKLICIWTDRTPLMRGKTTQCKTLLGE